jgi:hypothetical protein
MEENKNQKELALGKQNLILLAIGIVLIILGFILMLGSSSELEYNPDIYSNRRIVYAPITALFGFLFIIYAILKKKN